MTKLKEYVKNKKEVEIVSEVRKDYVKNYADLLIEKGNIKENDIVVDIPCGTGDMAKTIAERVKIGKFVLIDINENMVESAKEKVSNAIPIVGDAGDIGTLINFKVDTIISLNGFHQYIDRKKDFLQGCKKILKKNGRLIFDISTRGLNNEYTRNFFQNQIKEVISLSKKHKVNIQFPMWPDNKILEEYSDMVFNSGLEVIEKVEFTSFKTVADILSDAITIPGRSRPWIPGLNYEKRKDILTHSIEKTAKKLGEHPIEHNRIFFIAEKIN